jgi:hypothetical protein
MDSCVDALLRSIDTAENHVRSEYVRDLAGTMATVGEVPHYALTAEPGVVGVISGRDGVAAFYEMSHKVAVPQASRFLTQIAADWYMFVENMPTRRSMTDGSLRTVLTATLFITDTDGIKGEFIWERPPLDAAAEAAHDTVLRPVSLASVTLHEALLAAICDGDTVAIGSLCASNCSWAERDYLSAARGGALLQLRGAAATSNHFAQWHDRYRPERVSVLNRQVTDWYIFAEELWIVRTLGGGRGQLRKAVIYAVNTDGRIEAALGYGTDVEAPSILADLCVGQAFWPASEPEAGVSGHARTRFSSPM